MFGKVLLLALVCVAATEVLEVNLQKIIEEALKEVKVVHDRTFWTLNNALIIYYDNDLALYRTVREQVRILETLSERDIGMLNATAQKLVNFATQIHAKEEVFLCISNRRDGAVQDLNSAVSNYDETVTQTGDVKRQELFNVAFELFKIRATILFDDNIHPTREEIKKCTTPECVQEILTRYNNENVETTGNITKTIPRLNMNVEQSKREIRNTLNNGKRDINKVKGAGMNAMRACLVKTN